MENEAKKLQRWERKTWFVWRGVGYSSKSCQSPPTPRTDNKWLGDLCVSLLRIPSEGAGNWDRTFNSHSNRKENHVLSHKTSLFLSLLPVFLKGNPVFFHCALVFPVSSSSSAPVENIPPDFGTQRPDPKSITADEDQPIDWNWLWGGIWDAEVARTARGAGNCCVFSSSWEHHEETRAGRVCTAWFV